MKKGISAWTFTDRSPNVCFELAKKYGYDGVEIALGESGPVRFDSTAKEIENCKKVAEDYGLSFYSLVCDYCWQYSLTSDDLSIRQKAKETVIKQLGVANLLGCDTILILPGMVQGLSPDDAVVPYDVVYNRALDAVKGLAEYAEKYNVTIGLENVWNKFLLSPLEMRNFIDSIGSQRVGSYFDVGNVMINGFPEQWIDILGNRIAKVHFKDFKRSVGTANGFVDILDGDVDYPAVMKSLRKTGYDDWVTAEVFSADGDVEATLKKNSLAIDKILNF